MIRQVIIILSFFILMSCNNIDYKPKYKDFANAWERDNLIGKVNKLDEYKANVTDYETGEAEKPIIVFKKEFTEIGKISYQEHYSSFGKLEQYTRSKFDDKGYRIESVSEDCIAHSRTFTTAKYDDLSGKLVSAHVKINDSINMDVSYKYGKHGNIVEQTGVRNGDTTLKRFEYIYGEKGRIILKKQIENSKYGINEYLNEFKYDKNGNLIKVTNKSGIFGVSKLTYEYDGENRRKKDTRYNSEQIQKETSFNNRYNKTYEKFYRNGSLDKEIKYDYKFDNKGNWIERKALIKEHYGENNKWLPVYVETRKIEYYK